MKVFTVGVDTKTLIYLRGTGIVPTREEAEVSSPEDIGDWITDDLFDAVVFDLSKLGWSEMVPRHMRESGLRLPVIGIMREAEELSWAEQRSIFLENGGDDLLHSPPNPRELAATLRAIARRQKHSPVMHDSREFRNGDATVVVDLVTKRVAVNGIAVYLTGKEGDIVSLLATANGRVMSKEALLNGLYRPQDEDVEIKIIDVFICKARAKLESAHPDAKDIIETVWGRGYQMRSAAKPGAAASAA